MKLRNELVVAAPLDETWRTLLDVPRVASALPGATIEPGGDAGAYRGRIRAKVGPVTADYEGTARIEEVDEEARVASFYVQGSGSLGTAAATITSRVAEAPGGSRVVVETDLRVTGRAASFGRGLIEEVSARMLDQFARNLEAEITSPRAAAESPRPAPADDAAFDVGAAAWEPLLRRYGLPALLVVMLLLLLRRPKIIVIRQS